MENVKENVTNTATNVGEKINSISVNIKEKVNTSFDKIKEGFKQSIDKLKEKLLPRLPEQEFYHGNGEGILYISPAISSRSSRLPVVYAGSGASGGMGYPFIWSMGHPPPGIQTDPPAGTSVPGRGPPWCLTARPLPCRFLKWKDSPGSCPRGWPAPAMSFSALQASYPNLQ